MYQKYAAEAKQKKELNMEENYVMLHATNYLKKNKIPCFKYNYSLD